MGYAEEPSKPQRGNPIGALGKVFRLLVLWPACIFIVWLKQRGWTKPSFPTTVAEALDSPQQMAQIIAGDANATIDRPDQGEGLKHEPLKQRTNIVLTVGGQTVFIKFTTDRQNPLIIKGISGAFIRIPPEPAFYLAAAENEVQQDPAKLRIPRDVMKVPKLVATRYDQWRNASMLAMEFIDPKAYTVIPDSKPIHPWLIRMIIRRAAAFHALNWQPCATILPSTRGRVGADWLSVVDLYKAGARLPNPHFTTVWEAFKVFLEKESMDPNGCAPMCISHCDCRPGNMLFRKDIAEKPESKCLAALDDADAVVFADWEACAAAVYLWDPVYCMTLGLSSEEREIHFEPMLDMYVEILASELAREDRTKAEAERMKRMPKEKVRLVADIMTWMMYYCGEVLIDLGAVGEVHGNSDADSKAWEYRIAEACRRAAKPERGLAKAIGVKQADLDGVTGKFRL